MDLDPASFADSRLPLTCPRGPHTVRVLAHCRYSRTGEGLHRFVDPADKATYLYTQFEPADARRMFASFEQPDLKAEFAISAIAPQDWTVVSNGALLSVEPLGDGNARFEFAETKPISTYLTALVAGDYAPGRPAPCRPRAARCRRPSTVAGRWPSTWTPTGSSDITESASASSSGTSRSRTRSASTTRCSCPSTTAARWRTSAASPLRDEYVFRSRATPASYQVRDDTILHELSHMWFGDLVTMRWWDDLWLKESFATWASNFALSQIVDDPESAWASFTNGFKTWAYRQDQLPSTHPIAADMVDLEAVEQNFDGITYSKGASVLVQLVAFVGQEEFLAGVPPVLRAARVRQHRARRPAGRPAHRLRPRPVGLVGAVAGDHRREHPAARDRAGRRRHASASFAVRQSRPPRTTRRCGTTGSPSACTTRPGRSPADPDARRVGRDRDRHRPEPSGRTMPELVGLTQPDLLLVNDDDLTYAKVRLDPRSLQTVVGRLPSLESALARAVCWSATWDMCRDGELAAADYVELVLSTVAVESDPVAVRTVLGQAASAARHYTPPDRRAEVLLRWQDGVAELMDAAEPGSDLQLALVKAFPNAAEDDAEPTGWPAGWPASASPTGVEIDLELRWSSVLNLARLGRLDEAAIDAEADRDNTVTGAEQAAAAKAARPTAEAKAEAWRLAAEADDVPNGTQRAITLAFWQRGQDARAGSVRREVPDGGRGDLARRGRLVDEGVRACGRTCCATCSRSPSSWPRSSSGWTPGWPRTPWSTRSAGRSWRDATTRHAPSAASV